MLTGITAEAVMAFIAEHGVMAVVLGMVIEEVFVPIPSPVIPMAAGFLLIDSSLALGPALVQIFFLIALPASIASVLSSYFVYGIAHFGGKPVLEKYGRYIDVSWEEVQHLEEHFDSGNEKYYVALFRAVPIVPLSLISGSAGLFRMDWREYGIWSFIGMMPRNFILGYIGWASRDSIVQIASQINTVSTGILVAVALGVALVIAYRKTRDFYTWIFDASKV